MSNFNPETARMGQAQSSAPDTQTIIGLLGSLMPLLLQLQSQYPGHLYFAQPGPVPSDVGSGFTNLAPPSVMLDHQAAVEMMEDINACALRTLSTYLESYASQNTGLANAIPLVTQAARSFAARDQAQTFALIWQAYRAITMARAADSQLPPPRVGGLNQSSSSPASILH
jgi:hypothetical protein